jgi:hypothetical protein
MHPSCHVSLDAGTQKFTRGSLPADMAGRCMIFAQALFTTACKKAPLNKSSGYSDDASRGSGAAPAPMARLLQNFC